MAGRGRAGLGAAWHGMVRMLHGKAWHGVAGQGPARFLDRGRARRGTARRGEARFGLVDS